MESKTPENLESEKALGGQNSQAGEQTKIYLTQNTETFKPKKPHKAKHLLKKVSWDQLTSQNVTGPDFWGDKVGETQFVVSQLGFMVFSEIEEPKSEIPQYYVLKNEAFDKINNNSHLIVECNNNKLILSKEFCGFLNRIYTTGNSKLNLIFYSINYKNSFYSKSNIGKTKISEPFNAEIQLNDPTNLVSEKKLDFEKNIKQFDERINCLKNDLKSMESKKADFRIVPTGRDPWKEFTQKIDKILSELYKKDKKNKDNLNDFTHIFKADISNKTVEGFLKVYSEMKNKEKFYTSISYLPEEQKRWFFFDGNDWSNDSQNKFKNQFETDNLKKLNDDISKLEADLNKQNNLKNKKEMEKNRELENLKTEQKATLNFYLDEADPEPFLSTEVTIPFPSQPEPSVNTTHPLTQ